MISPDELTPVHVNRFKSQYREEGPGECWLWTGLLSSRGYGRLRIGTEEGAHRISWTLANGSIPDGLSVLHRCDVRACVNPSHLFLGTLGDNIRDCTEKGRNARGESHGMVKLTAVQVIKIRAMRASGVSYSKIGLTFDVNKDTARYACNGRNWKHIKEVA